MRHKFIIMMTLLLVSETTSVAQQNTETAIGESQARIDELSKQPVPEKDTVLLHESDRLEQEIDKLNSMLSNSFRYKDFKQRIDGLFDELSKAARKIIEFDCKSNSTNYRDVSVAYTNILNNIVSNSYSLNPDIDFKAIDLPVMRPTDLETCKVTKERLSSPNYDKDLKNVSDSLSQLISNLQTRDDKVNASNSKLLDALKHRRTLLQDKLNSGQAQLQIVNYLPWILGILSLGGLLTIMAIRMFDPIIQMEWVASGQVIQFVTVMVLLSVIVALGLSNILKEQVLGTLLGGVAGYVLAQGVGRAAARDVRRGSERGEAHGTRPPESPPPTA
jgi:hypothetical protein